MSMTSSKLGAMAKPVGIREVAEAAGVSVTTVSHALNGKGRLPLETRTRVRAVAADLGYTPRIAARNLGGGRSGLIGLFMSEAEGLPSTLSGNNYFTELLGAATGAALEHGYALVLATAANSQSEPWRRWALDGAIVVDPVRGDPVLTALREADMPLVTTGRPTDGIETYWVDNDIVAGTRSMLDHLARRGARRIALIDSAPIRSVGLDLREAYAAFCADTAMAPMIAEAAWDLSEHAGFDAALQLLERADPPDAIYTSYDRLALGVLLAADASGLSVPRDLLVAGCTDSVAARMSSPSLTVLTLNPTDVGTRAVELLVALLEERPAPEHEYVATGIISRGSTRRSSRRGRNLPAVGLAEQLGELAAEAG